MLSVAGAEREGNIAMLDGEVVSAATGHLMGTEAALALLTARDGVFEFHRASAEEIAREGTAAAVASLVMEAARLDDELERLRDVFPGDDARLELLDAERLPGDPLACGIEEVFAALAACPGGTYRTIEQLVPLAPAKTKLSVCWLSAHGMLVEGAASRSTSGLEHDWWSRLLNRPHSGLRVVVGTSPYLDVEDLWPAFDHLAAELGAEPAAVTVLADGPTLARVRPAGGGLISFVVMPVLRKHRARFEALVATSQVALLTAAASADDLDAYRAVVPPSVPVRTLAAESTARTLTDALRDLALSAPNPAAFGQVEPGESRSPSTRPKSASMA